jgi:acyl-CoA thioester hydrolase
MAQEPPEASRAFEVVIPVVADDIDDMGHVNNVVYLKWVNAVAVAHWLARATPQMLTTVGWVATRHELDYVKAAMPGDVIVARTWIGAVDSRRFERLTAILRQSDGATLLRARTFWMMVSRESGRIIRITDDVRARFDQDAGARLT